MRLKSVLLFLSSLLSLFAFAQKGSISGTLLDSANHKLTLNYATVSIYKGTDTILTDYKLSNEKGIFKLTGLDIGQPYRLVVNAWMYNVAEKQLILNADRPDLNLGELYLPEKTNTLQEVLVKDVPPVLVRKDTIEFNAASFKTLPTAVVEDLLRKLPGVNIADDGSIIVNGKPVSRILVDGKQFFGGDQQIATKNLPAHVIDKIQVVDDQEAKRRDPNLIVSETPQVINLKLKQAIKKGAFGKLYAGGGAPNDRYEAGGIMNFFRDTTQISLLAYGNNVNKPGFALNDVARIGGMQRSGINSVSIQSDGRYELNGIGFGGSSSGVQQSSGAGANFNTLTKGGTKINTKYFFGQSNNALDMLTNTEQNLGSNKLFSNNRFNQINKNYNHNISSRIEMKLDSLTQLTIEPNVIFNRIRNTNPQIGENRDLNNQLLSSTNNNSIIKGNNTDLQLNASLWKDFKKAGRSFNTSVNIVNRNNLNDNFNTSLAYFFNPASTTNIDQLRDNDIRNFNAFLSVNYTEPISKKLSFTVRSNANYIDNQNALVTFYRNPASQAYDIVIPDFTQTVVQQGAKTNSGAELKWNPSKTIQIRPGLVFNTINLNNTFTTYNDFKQNFTFFAPSLAVRIKDLNINYNPVFREPDVNYIQPITNNTNPLYIQNGNPNLRPTRQHQVGLNLFKYDVKRNLSYNANASFNFQNDGIIMARTITGSGVQITNPINVDGIYNLYGNVFLGKDFKKAKKQFNISGGLNANYNRNIVEVNGTRSYARIIALAPNASGRINLNDKFEFSQRYSLSINKSTYDDSFYSDINYLTHSAQTNMVVRLPKKLVWETTYQILYNTQTVGGFSNNVQIWNAGLTYLFMKNDRAQLKFSVNDILNTNTRRQITITENMVRDVTSNNLGRHGLLTLTYNIQNFGQKVGGTQSMFRF